MPAFLAPMATRLVLALLALAALLGVVFYIWYLRDAVASARQAVAQSRGTIAQLAADNQADLAALAQMRAQNALWQAADAMRREIDAARPSANGPVAPVLVSTLRAIARAQGQKVAP
ncbi:MAG: hypothetical protein B7X48_02680 [Acidiphilium sp. 34-60-192]|nr:MAG: hypothetical protein B7X48_02680 [Acidiphilium sp. 34-60-192]